MRAIVAEGAGSALLLIGVVGSGIMGERLADGNVAIALLANSLATGAALVVIILTFGPVSGAHLNPAVTLAAASQGGLPTRSVLPYIASQLTGGIVGTVIGNLMFGEPAIAWSQHARNGPGQLLGEFVATFGLLAVIWGTSRTRAAVVPFAVGAYITSAYWFTSSTSFANPAVTIARCLTDTFAGIRPGDAPAFIVMQFAGAAAATVLFRWLLPDVDVTAERIVMSHAEGHAHRNL
jgi:glycerol uptake facilitator-like aquaporin